MVYAALRPVVRVALAWYYRGIRVSGVERIPARGPVFLAVNHPNALVDALVVGAVVPRRVGFTAKATIFANPLLARFLHSAGVVPLRRAADEAKQGAPQATDPDRNAASFDAVADALSRDAAIVIFPEGKSHDDPKLAPLRTGLARMAQHAVGTRGVHGLRIVPVGLLFEQKERPRSRVLVQVGEPIDVDTLLAAQASVATITQVVSDRLASVTLNFESAEDAEHLHVVGTTLAALLHPAPSLGDDETPLADTLAVVRRLDRARRRLREQGDPVLEARAAHFEQRVRDFRHRLETLRLDVHDLTISPGTGAGLRFAVRELLLAGLLVPVGLWGRLTHIVPIQLARALALRNARNRDEPAMNTLVIGLVLVLAAYTVQTALVWWAAGPWWALAFLATLVPSASSDLRYGDRMRRATNRMRAWFTFRRDPALQQALVAEGTAIRAEAGSLESVVVTHTTAG